MPRAMSCVQPSWLPPSCRPWPRRNRCRSSRRSSLAVQRSEAARAGRAAATGAGEAARAAGQLPDPMLRAGIENLPVTGPDRFSTTRESMTMKRIGISQEWLSADKRDARERAARGRGRTARPSRPASPKARPGSRLRWLTWTPGTPMQALKLTTLRTSTTCTSSWKLRDARLAGATGSSVEVLAAELRRGDGRGRERARRASCEAQRWSSLQRWVGFAAGGPDDRGPRLAMPSEREYRGATPVARVAAARGRGGAPGRGRRREASATPNWTWEVAYGQRTGYSDLVTLGVSIPLQLAPSQRQDRETAARLALVEKAEAELAEAGRGGRGRVPDDGQRRDRACEQRIRALPGRGGRLRLDSALPQRSRHTVPTRGRSPALFEARHAEDGSRAQVADACSATWPRSGHSWP